MIDFSNATKWTGNTYPIRAELKEFGGKWDEDAKAWFLPPVSGQAETVKVTRLWLGDNVEVREIEA